MNGPTIEFKAKFNGRRKGQRLKGESPVARSRVPRIAKTMALAIHLQQMIRDGLATDQADLAQLGGVTRARLTQIMNLLLLAPDIQEALLLLEPTGSGPNVVNERDLRQVVAEADWRKQRKMWSNLRGRLGASVRRTEELLN
jgi:hypothetical protein